ncbi:MAG: HEAT repeat domain-containing protein [Myxococcota bacterium]|jgi:hypothetical protein|nr:HEAT repeat domain-containing protein [Myxococcota bacterium]
MNPKNPNRTSSHDRVGGPLLAALLLALLAITGCGEAGSPSGNTAADYEERRFQFVRAGTLILRVDTQLGVVWVVEETGDGGWVMLGATPDDDDEPNWNGRYALFSLKPAKLGGPARLLRSDRATGRSWLALAEEGSRWSIIEEGGGRNSKGGGSQAQPAPRAATGATQTSLPVVSKEIIEASPGENAEKFQVVVEALEKEGLPVEIKVWAASQLAVFPPDEAIPPLLDALKSEHSEVVIAAIHSLKSIGRPSTIPKILALSDHPDPKVQSAVQSVVVSVP